MGKSRSATVLIAYLLWATRRRSSNQKLSDSSDMVSLPPKPLSVAQALELLRQGRPIAEPNEGFMDQLHMYEAMGCPTTEDELKAHKIYRRWMNKRKVDESLRVMQAPEMEHIIFEDESDDVVSNDVDGNSRATSGMVEVAPGISAPDGTDESKSQAHPKLQSSPQVTIKCRKCRHVLATTPFLLEHHPPPHRDPSTEQYKPLGETPLPPPQCAHIFLHPLSWMREVLSESKMEGRLTCPNKRCGTNLGKFAWTGLRCSCGGWVTPGFGIIRTKVDEIIKPRSQTGGELNKKESGSVPKDGTSTLTAAMGGLRFPPGQKRNGNL